MIAHNGNGTDSIQSSRQQSHANILGHPDRYPRHISLLLFHPHIQSYKKHLCYKLLNNTKTNLPIPPCFMCDITRCAYRVFNKGPM